VPARHATPWFDINGQCATALNQEVNTYLEGNDLAAACRTLTVPTLIIDGALDIRPRTAVDSLHLCLPRVRRTTLNAGHLPWVEDPDGFRETVAAFLTPPEHRPG
jgi:proline iminopeptidase